MTFLLLANLFFVHPTPQEMPRAHAYRMKENDVSRLEDRFDVRDLWLSRAILGCWEDDDGRLFTLAKLSEVPPLATEAETLTREKYVLSRPLLNQKDLKIRDDAIARLSPLEMPERAQRPRFDIHHLKETLYFHGTNTSAIVCAFLPENRENWYFASWQLLPTDDFEKFRENFENQFLRKWNDWIESDLVTEKIRENSTREKLFRENKKEIAKNSRKMSAQNFAKIKFAKERELLRADARASIANYRAWHATDGESFVVLDDLPRENSFVVALTNELTIMREKYNASFSSPLDSSNTLCVARIFRDRDEYLDSVGEELRWTAAYWSPARRELVAYLPREGADALMRTIRHEAFHQYLSYACAMMAPAPWLNEGFAQYFEDENSRDWRLPPELINFDALVELLPALFAMDYETFYAGTRLEQLLKYRLAWSVAVFLEKGAPEVRFQPFANFKSDYLAHLLRTQDGARATELMFGSSEKQAELIAAWRKFWEAK